MVRNLVERTPSAETNYENYKIAEFGIIKIDSKNETLTDDFFTHPSVLKFSNISIRVSYFGTQHFIYLAYYNGEKYRLSKRFFSETELTHLFVK